MQKQRSLWVRRARETVANSLPPRVMAFADWVRPSRHIPYGGGPMNGQLARRAIMRHLVHVAEPGLVVETGTHRGGSTAFLADISGAQVITVEAWERSFLFASWRFQGRTDIRVVHDDSRHFLKGLALDDNVRSSRVLFYIDAHGGEGLPLTAELDIIASSWDEAVVVIDDFEVPGDAGYGFDDWGSGGRLTEDVLPNSVASWRRYYPATPSSEETGLRRGCVVLVPPRLAGLPWEEAHLR